MYIRHKVETCPDFSCITNNAMRVRFNTSMELTLPEDSVYLTPKHLSFLYYFVFRYILIIYKYFEIGAKMM